MVVALLLLSLAMILGGLAALVFGWDIVLNERGWAMVIAGSVCAGSGAILLGLTAAVGRLGRIRSDLSALRDEIGRLGAPMPPPPVMDPVAAVSSGLLAGGGTEQETGRERSPDAESQPTLPLFAGEAADAGAPSARPAPDGEAPPAPEDDRSEFRPLADEPVPFPVPPRRFGEARAAVEEPAARRMREPPPDAEPEVAATASRTARGAAPVVEPAAREEPELAPPPQPPATVIGTYNSGDNRYVMFSDGSIEATTPDGVFRFDSLEELKEFIASGGEDRSTAP